MARAKLNSDGRIITWMEQGDFDRVIDEDKPLIAEQFPVVFENPEIFEQTVSWCMEDYRIENGEAIFDPLPESRKEIWREEVMEQAPEHMASTDDALCELYETALAQSDIIDQQDAAICALYEMIG